jgi:hypothetical protein
MRCLFGLVCAEFDGSCSQEKDKLVHAEHAVNLAKKDGAAAASQLDKLNQHLDTEQKRLDDMMDQHKGAPPWALRLLG